VEKRKNGKTEKAFLGEEGGATVATESSPIGDMSPNLATPVLQTTMGHAGHSGMWHYEHGRGQLCLVSSVTFLFK